jgi:hypothetical protein
MYTSCALCGSSMGNKYSWIATSGCTHEQYFPAFRQALHRAIPLRTRVLLAESLTTDWWWWFECASALDAFFNRVAPSFFEGLPPRRYKMSKIELPLHDCRVVLTCLGWRSGIFNRGPMITSSDLSLFFGAGCKSTSVEFAALLCSMKYVCRRFSGVTRSICRDGADVGESWDNFGAEVVEMTLVCMSQSR